MLSADVQAVISAYYSRNLREEVKKGFYGRLKQGFYPMPAPLGYLDAGGGKPKTPDPERAPLIKKAFEFYATGKYSYALYVYHLPVIWAARQVFTPVGLAQGLLFAVVVGTATYSLAVVSWYAWERPWLALKRLRLRYSDAHEYDRIKWNVMTEGHLSATLFRCRLRYQFLTDR